MGGISKWNSPVFAEAFLLWTAHGRAAWPQRDYEAVVCCFGAEIASELLPAMESLEKEFYLSDAHITARDLVEMGKMAREEFEAKHPEVADEVLKALVWCYVFDYK